MHSFTAEPALTPGVLAWEMVWDDGGRRPQLHFRTIEKWSWIQPMHLRFYTPYVISGATNCTLLHTILPDGKPGGSLECYFKTPHRPNTTRGTFSWDSCCVPNLAALCSASNPDSRRLRKYIYIYTYSFIYSFFHLLIYLCIYLYI